MTGRNLGACLLVFAFVSSAIAQEKTDKPADTPNAELLRRLLDKVDQLDRDLKTVLKNAPKALPENPADRKLVALLETPVIQTFHVGVRNNQPVEQRVFVATRGGHIHQRGGRKLHGGVHVLTALVAEGQGQVHDRGAVDAGKPRHGSQGRAFNELVQNGNLFVARERVHRNRL